MNEMWQHIKQRRLMEFVVFVVLLCLGAVYVVVDLLLFCLNVVLLCLGVVYVVVVVL